MKAQCWSPSRRDLLKGLASAAGLLPVGGLLAQATKKAAGTTNRRRVDVHHHMLPPFIDLWKGRKWSPEVSLETMDKFGTETAVLSVTGLQPTYADLFYEGTEKSRTFVRKMNDYGAKAVSDNRKRFGLFACLPLPDQDAVHKEIEYALDTLKADGFMLFSNMGDKWPGDPAFRPMFEELNRRKAIVFIHPSIPKCCRNFVPGVGDTTVEFDFDTTRAITSMLFNGVLAQFPDVRFIVNHSGAAVPVLSGRIKDQVRGERDKLVPGGSAGAWEELRKLYFECAHASYPAPMAALEKFAPPTQFLFGTDYPVWPYDTTINPLNETEPELSDEVQHMMDRGNAERLFPRLKS
jgi:predicted TIM-barrel fold metal-dependent hydrolase